MSRKYRDLPKFILLLENHFYYIKVNYLEILKCHLNIIKQIIEKIASRSLKAQNLPHLITLFNRGRGIGWLNNAFAFSMFI
jgi:uncharacterized protein (DUF608 family)